MKFEKAAHIASLLAKDYAREMLALLGIYKNISASEAAARLDLHIKTAQDFLEGLYETGIVTREEVSERKRPYYRYGIALDKIEISLDLPEIAEDAIKKGLLDKKVKEKKNAPALFSTSSIPKTLSSVTLITGDRRNKKERKIALTENQGRFLFFLPFPTESAVTVSSLIETAGIGKSFLKEILDIIALLSEHNVIEIV